VSGEAPGRVRCRKRGIASPRDQDLLVLGKPFGVEIITPRELLTRLAAV
jgi:hypothetical protein